MRKKSAAMRFGYSRRWLLAYTIWCWWDDAARWLIRAPHRAQSRLASFAESCVVAAMLAGYGMWSGTWKDLQNVALFMTLVVAICYLLRRFFNWSSQK